MTIPVSVVILTKNEAANISSTIASTSRFSEVIIVDSGSADDTVGIALAHDARVVEFRWDGRYPKKKQWALDNAGVKNDWVLLLDADERPDELLVDSIDAAFSSPEGPNVGAFDLELRYHFAGRALKYGHRVVKRSLVNRTRVRFPEIADLEAPGIREVEGHYQPQTRFGVSRLKGLLDHEDRDPVREWFDRHNRYSDWEAYLNLQPRAKRSVAALRTSKGAIFDRVPFKPLVFFIYCYVLRQGIRDGRAGFDYAFALSHYYWQVGLKTRELQRVEAAGSS